MDRAPFHRRGCCCSSCWSATLCEQLADVVRHRIEGALAVVARPPVVVAPPAPRRRPAGPRLVTFKVPGRALVEVSLPASASAAQLGARLTAAIAGARRLPRRRRPIVPAVSPRPPAREDLERTPKVQPTNPEPPLVVAAEVPVSLPETPASTNRVGDGDVRIGRPPKPRPTADQVREVLGRTPRPTQREAAAELGCSLRALREVAAGLEPADPEAPPATSNEEPATPDEQLDAAAPAAARERRPYRDVKPANVAQAAALQPAGTGTPCRVCKVDDGDERVQPDLHRRCMERATTQAAKRRAVRRPRTAAAPGPVLTRAELVARLARDRAAGDERAALEPRRRGRPPKNAARPRDVEPSDHDQEEEIVFTGDEVAAIDQLARGRGLATIGLGGDDA
jgi:hypothetical protein